MNETPLRMDVVRDGALARLTIVGEVDDTNVATVAATIVECRRAPAEVVELDLSAVDYLGSAGVRALAEAEEHATGATVRIVAASTIVRRVLELTGLSRMADRSDSELSGDARGRP